jgi:hypothetical protein
MVKWRDGDGLCFSSGMIDDAVLFLRQHLSSALKSLSSAAPEDLAEEPVVFVDDAKMDLRDFQAGSHFRVACQY